MEKFRKEIERKIKKHICDHAQKIYDKRGVWNTYQDTCFDIGKSKVNICYSTSLIGKKTKKYETYGMYECDYRIDIDDNYIHGIIKGSFSQDCLDRWFLKLKRQKI